MRHAVVVGAIVVAGCAVRPPPPALSPVPRDGLVVTLAWSAPVDLDLYVTDPGLETVYFANPRARSGGILERDARCADGAAASREERVRWTAPPPGRYRIGVDYIEPCGRAARDVPYRLVVDANGRRVERTGRARLAERDSRVFEATVEGGVR
jgi:hypothetical protein